ncbi:class II histocompatibility antigen, B-L beta chain-like isoform X1 [Strix uralensis]|uniref:class II histocompatibility antigen, B-L beta chain-like isoform X1 n=1 Tax=Strix uralensis TaxID=36305 RepID=UPI003DA75FA9
MLPSLAPHWASLGLPVAHWAGAGPFPERAECGWLGGPRTCPASAVSAMETGRVLGAGAVLVALVVLGAHAAGGEEPSGVFLRMDEGECQYLNGTERVRFVLRQIYNREQFVHFDSDVGLFVADTALGEFQAQYFNSQPDVLEQERAEVDRFCRHNYQVGTPFITERKVPPEVEIYPVQSSSLPQIDRLVCAVMDFYPAEIEVKWFQNGREETERVVSTDVIPNGDWTYQVLVMLETTPQRGDTYTCQVEHVSLQHPVSQRWELQWDGARSKMLTGVGGFVLGLIFLVLGLGLYVRKKGAPIPGLQGS